jgi:uncharacterized protein
VPRVPDADRGEDLGLQTERAVQGDHRRCREAARGEVLTALFVLLLSLPDQPTGPINDYAHALSATQLSQLDAQLRGYEQGTTRQIAVAIFPSLDGESMEDVSIRLAEKWKLGGKQSNDGVLVTLFLEDRKLRIEPGYGLEDKLTDAVCAHIIRDVMVPRLQQNDLAGALQAGLAAIDTVTSGRAHEEGQPPATTTSSGDGGSEWIIIGFILVVIVILAARSRFGGGSFWGGGGGGWTSGGSGWSSSGGGGGWSGGGGGGWSGGGGSFGGGGSSGSW